MKYLLAFIVWMMLACGKHDSNPIEVSEYPKVPECSVESLPPCYPDPPIPRAP